MHVETVLLPVLGAVAVVVAARCVAARTGMPSAALLVVAGPVYALLPEPDLSFDPETVPAVPLPPLPPPTPSASG